LASSSSCRTGCNRTLDRIGRGSCLKGRRDYLTAAFSFEPTETFTRLPAGMLMVSPVRALRPVRAAVVAVSNESQPGIETLPPLATVSETAEKRLSSTADTAAWL